jgi:hypothetical protein
MATKQLLNLIKKHGAEELKQMIDTAVFEEQDYNALKKLTDDDETASAWFRNWAKENNLTVKETYKGRRLDIEEFDMDSPYVVLWLAHNDETAHFELGASLSELWWARGLQDLETKLARILRMRKETA